MVLSSPHAALFYSALASRGDLLMRLSPHSASPLTGVLLSYCNALLTWRSPHAALSSPQAALSSRGALLMWRSPLLTRCSPLLTRRSLTRHSLHAALSSHCALLSSRGALLSSRGALLLGARFTRCSPHAAAVFSSLTRRSLTWRSLHAAISSLGISSHGALLSLRGALLSSRGALLLGSRFTRRSPHAAVVLSSLTRRSLTRRSLQCALLMLRLYSPHAAISSRGALLTLRSPLLKQCSPHVAPCEESAA